MAQTRRGRPASALAALAVSLTVAFPSVEVAAAEPPQDRSPATLEYSSWFGGEESDSTDDVARDAEGNIYVLGRSGSSTFDTSTVRDYRAGSLMDSVFVAKLSPDARQLHWVTLYGGSGFDAPNALAVSPAGFVYAVGRTDSGNLIMKRAFQDRNRGCPSQESSCAIDGFVMGLNTQGELVRSSYFGGERFDELHDVDIDSRGSVYLAGYTTSDDLAVKAALQPRSAGRTDIVIAKFTRGLRRKVFLTYLGGSRFDSLHDITVRRGGIVAVGSTVSDDFPTKAAWEPELRRASDGMVFSMSLHGQRLRYSSYLGTRAVDTPSDVLIDKRGRIVMAGWVRSSRLMRQKAAVQDQSGGRGDIFIARLTRDRERFELYAVLGGSGFEALLDLARSPGGALYVSGHTDSADFPMHNSYQQSPSLAPECLANSVGCSDGFVAKIRPGRLLKSSYLGGSRHDAVETLVPLGNGRLLVFGSTDSPDFPVKDPMQPTLRGTSDAFVTLFSGF